MKQVTWDIEFFESISVSIDSSFIDFCVTQTCLFYMNHVIHVLFNLKEFHFVIFHCAISGHHGDRRASAANGINQDMISVVVLDISTGGVKVRAATGSDVILNLILNNSAQN